MIAAGRFRDAARRIARDAAGCADRLAHAAQLNLDSPAGAAEACAVFTEARRWEVQAWDRFNGLTRGCQPALGGIWPERPAFPPADGETLASAESGFRGIALRLDGAARGTASVLMVPEEARPPRHARLTDGAGAKALTEDLLGLRDAPPGVDATDEDVGQWKSKVQGTLGRLEAVAPDPLGPGAQFLGLMQGIGAAGNPLVGDPAALRHAYVLLGVDYVTEVHRRMPEYAEASGRSSKFTFNVSGDMNVGNMAETITIIGSTIQGVASQGDSSTADALKDVAQAIVDEPGLDDKTRHNLLVSVGDLAESAGQEPGKRDRGKAAKALAALNAAAATGIKIGNAMNLWEDVLRKILS